MAQANKNSLSTQTQAPPAAAIPGPVRAAILLLALGEENGSAIWQSLNDDEARLVSSIMAKLGSVKQETLLRVAADFMREVSTSQLAGGPERTEKILLGALPRPQARSIIEDIKTPENPTLWQKLSLAKPDQLADYLSKEYPQTVAVVLSKLSPEQSAKVLSLLPSNLATDLIDRMLRMEPVSDDVLKGIEKAIEEGFVTPPPLPGRRDPMDYVAQIFNAFDKKYEGRFLAALDATNRSAAQKLRALMFSFDELAKMDATSAQTLLRSVEREQMVKALKGSTKGVREFFFSQMSQRAARSFMEDMEMLGPVRLKEVDEAQRAIVNLAKDLASKGEIVLATNSNDDEMIN
jgi:flagellar motor switch protein FliG